MAGRPRVHHTDRASTGQERVVAHRKSVADLDRRVAEIEGTVPQLGELEGELRAEIEGALAALEARFLRLLGGEPNTETAGLLLAMKAGLEPQARLDSMREGLAGLDEEIDARAVARALTVWRDRPRLAAARRWADRTGFELPEVGAAGHA